MPDITLDRADGVATIALSAPERRNALTLEMAEQLVQACDEVDADPSIGAVVITGGEYFCAGGDRQTLADAGRDPATPDAWDGIGLVYRSFARVGELEPPTVAAIRGGAVGAGVNLAFATDLRVVATGAKIISGFLRIGLHPGGGFFTIAGRTAGREATAAMGLFSQEVDGRRAAEIGLAWAAVPDDEVEDTAHRLAAQPAKDPALSREAVRSFRTELGPPGIGWEAAVEFERATQMWSQRRRGKS